MPRFTSSILLVSLLVSLRYASAQVPNEGSPAAQGWDKARCLTTGPGPRFLSYNFARCVAADEAGRLHIVWYEARDGKEHAFYKRSLDEGKIWEADFSLSNSSARMPKTAILPSVATAGPKVYAVWHELRAGKVSVFLRRSSDGGRNWAPAIQLSYGPGNSMVASVAATASDVHVVWVGTREGQENTYYRRSTDGGDTWGDEKRLPEEPNESSVSYVPSITASGNDVVLAWVDTRDGNEEEYVNVSHDRGATWGKDVRMSHHPGNSWAPSVAISGKTVHLLWFDQMDSPVQPAEAEKKLDEIMILVGLTPLGPGPAGAHMPNPDLAAMQRAGERMRLIQKESQAWIANGGDAERLQRILNEVHEMAEPPGLSKAEAKLNEALELVGLAEEKGADDEKDMHKRMDAKVKRVQAAAPRWVQSGGDQKKLNAMLKEFQGLVSSEGVAGHMEKEEKLDEAIKLMGLKYTPGPLRNIPRVDHGEARAMRIRVRMRKIQAASSAWVQQGGDPKKLDAMLNDFTRSMGLATKEWDIYYRRSNDLGAHWGPTVRLTNSRGLSHRPSVAVAGDKIHVAWWDDRDGNNKVYYKQSTDAGVTWGEDSRLTNAVGDSHYPAIAVSRNYVHVVWLDTRDGSPQIYYLRKVEGTGEFAKDQDARKRLTSKVAVVQAGVQKWQASGRDPSATAQAMEKKFKPLIEAGKVVEAEAELDRVLELLKQEQE